MFFNAKTEVFLKDTQTTEPIVKPGESVKEKVITSAVVCTEGCNSHGSRFIWTDKEYLQEALTWGLTSQIQGSLKMLITSYMFLSGELEVSLIVVMTIDVTSVICYSQWSLIIFLIWARKLLRCRSYLPNWVTKVSCIYLSTYVLSYFWSQLHVV